MTSKKEIQKAISELDMKASEEIADTLQQLLTKGLGAGMTPKDSLSLSDDVMETIYSHAYNLYNNGKYSEASYIFRLLIMLDCTLSKYQMGLAACLHMEKKYLPAAQVYCLTGMLNPGDPLPYYHAADCYIQLGSPAAAVFMLETAVTEAGEQPEYSILTERCRMMNESLADDAKKEVERNAEMLKGAKEEVKKSKKTAKKATKKAKKAK